MSMARRQLPGSLAFGSLVNLAGDRRRETSERRRWPIQTRGVSAFRGCRSTGCRELGIGNAQAVSHPLQQRVPKAGYLGHGVELTRPDDEQFHIRQGCDRGVAKPAVQGHQLSKNVTWSERVHQSASLR